MPRSLRSHAFTSLGSSTSKWPAPGICSSCMGKRSLWRLTNAIDSLTLMIKSSCPRKGRVGRTSVNAGRSQAHTYTQPPHRAMDNQRLASAE